MHCRYGLILLHDLNLQSVCSFFSPVHTGGYKSATIVSTVDRALICEPAKTQSWCTHWKAEVKVKLKEKHSLPVLSPSLLIIQFNRPFGWTFGWTSTSDENILTDWRELRDSRPTLIIWHTLDLGLFYDCTNAGLSYAHNVIKTLDNLTI